jgi:hypothetical protein
MPNADMSEECINEMWKLVFTVHRSGSVIFWLLTRKEFCVLGVMLPTFSVLLLYKRGNSLTGKISQEMV